MRVAGIDLLRGIAAFGIVGCHLSLAPRTAGGEWVTVLCDCGVGVFAAIAGWLMGRGGHKEHREHREYRGMAEGLGYAGRRAKRLLPTYFFWSGVFIAATCAFDLILDGGRLNPKYGTVGFWIRVIFLGDASTHLWFLPCLLYAQVVMKALEWVAARTECGPYRVGVPCLGLGLGLCAISCWLGNWFGTYPLRLFAFLVTGYGLGRMEVKLPRAWAGGLTVAGLVAFVSLDGVVPAFVRGWFVTVPLLGFFAALEWNGFSHREHKEHREGWGWRDWGMAEVLGATSMGVYLVHPLVTRALSVVWARVFGAPYGAMAVVGEWVLAWGVALAAAMVLLRVPWARRFVR